MNISITEIGGVKIDVFSDYDGLPVKSQLPEELKERLKTEKQWLWEGYVVKPEEKERGYSIHPTMLNKKLCIYYFEDQVSNIQEGANIKNCSTCNWPSKNHYCICAGGRVSPDGRCSEWEKRL